MRYFEVNFSVRLHPQTIPANNIATRWDGTQVLAAVPQAPLQIFACFAMEYFLKGIGAEVEVNTDDQYQFLSVYLRHNAPSSVA